MKKIFISQRLDKVGKFYELRDNLDTRFSLFFEKLGMIPIIVPNNYYQTKTILKKIKPNGIILSPGGDPQKKDARYKTEYLLMNHAKQKNNPLLAICRGAQALNNFFGNVMVNVADIKIKGNRLAILKQVLNTLKIYADFSKIQK